MIVHHNANEDYVVRPRLRGTEPQTRGMADAFLACGDAAHVHPTSIAQPIMHRASGDQHEADCGNMTSANCGLLRKHELARRVRALFAAGPSGAALVACTVLTLVQR